MQSAATFLIVIVISSCSLVSDSFAQEPAGSGAKTGMSSLRFETKWLAIDTNEACDVGDINKDGQMDVVAGRNWFAGPDFLPRPVRGIGEFGEDYSENNGEHLYDIDGDGWLDVVAGSFLPTEIKWFRNPGKDGLQAGKLWIENVLVDTGFSQNEMSWLRDMNGDGAPDFVTNSWNKEMRLAYWTIEKGTSKEDPPVATRVIVGTSNGHGQGYGDLNGDGLEDIVFGNGWYERPAANAEKGRWKLHPDFELPHASCPILVVDIDKDGRNDLVWGSGHNYGLNFYRQLEPKGGKLLWEKNVVDKSWSQAHALTLADIDGDGQDEIITGKRVRAHSGKDPGATEESAIYFYEWDAESKKFIRHQIATGVGTGLQIRVADMNGDKRLDVVVAGKDGTQILFQVK
jgi:hypothetical protein